MRKHKNPVFIWVEDDVIKLFDYFQITSSFLNIIFCNAGFYLWNNKQNTLKKVISFCNVAKGLKINCAKTHMFWD